MKSADAIDAGAYDILELLPAHPEEAEATLAMVEQALAHPGKQPDGWTGAASYAFNFLRKRDLETAAAIIIAARGIVQTVGPHFA